MRGLAGCKEYLDLLMDLYDEHEDLGTIALLEIMRLTGCSHQDANDHWEGRKRTREENAASRRGTDRRAKTLWTA